MPVPFEPTSNVLTTLQAAKILKMAPKNLRRMAKNGEIPASLIGNDWRFMRHVIEKLAAEK